MGLIKGRVLWAKIYPEQLDTRYAKDETGGIWSIEMVVDDSNKKVLKDEGLDHLIHTKDDGTKVIKFKRNEIQKSTGNKNTPPKVVDSKKNAMTSDILIGNGSECNISFTTYTGYKSKKYATLQSVQVLNLVKFEKKSTGLYDGLDEVEGGFTVDEASDEIPFNTKEAV